MGYVISLVGWKAQRESSLGRGTAEFGDTAAGNPMYLEAFSDHTAVNR